MCAAIRFMSRWKPSVRTAAFILFFFGILPTPTRAQRKAITQDEYIQYVRDFLHVFYPGLSDKKYWITIETSEPYENVSAAKRSSKTFLVDIGDGRKSEVLMCCFGGTMGGPPIGSNVPYDKELGPPHPPPPPPQPSPRPDGRNIDSNGAVHPTQYLSTAFVFDPEGYLKVFNVDKEKKTDAVLDFWETLRLNPDMSDEELKAAYKASGAKYSLGDRETFKRELPVSQLEPFLGTLKIVQITFNPTVERLAKLGGFSDCEVELEGPNKKQYLAYFAAYSGRIITVLYLTEKEMKLRRKGTN
jgi:hypothetical protein